MNGGIVCSHCHMIGHLRKNYEIRVLESNVEKKKGKTKVVVQQSRNQMNQTYRKQEEGINNAISDVEVTQSNGLGDLNTAN